MSTAVNFSNGLDCADAHAGLDDHSSHANCQIFPLRSPNEPWHVISYNVAFWHEQTQTSLYSLPLSLETPNLFGQ